MNTAYTIAQCRSVSGHVGVGGNSAPCYRCGMQLAGPGGSGPDKATFVARPADVPDPLNLIGGER